MRGLGETAEDRWGIGARETAEIRVKQIKKKQIKIKDHLGNFERETNKYNDFVDTYNKQWTFKKRCKAECKGMR